MEISGKLKFINELESVPLIRFMAFNFFFSINFTVRVQLIGVSVLSRPLRKI